MLTWANSLCGAKTDSSGYLSPGSSFQMSPSKFSCIMIMCDSLNEGLKGNNTNQLGTPVLCCPPT